VGASWRVGRPTDVVVACVVEFRRIVKNRRIVTRRTLPLLYLIIIRRVAREMLAAASREANGARGVRRGPKVPVKPHSMKLEEFRARLSLEG
jgi:hypothetical protein